MPSSTSPPATVPPTATAAPATSVALTVPADLASFGTEVVTVGEERWLVAVADEPEERRQGLMGVSDLGALDGMIFVFATDTNTQFFMRTVPIPLDIGFFDGEGRLLEVIAMAPCGDRDDCPLYGPTQQFRAAIERPAGGWSEVPIGSLLVREN